MGLTEKKGKERTGCRITARRLGKKSRWLLFRTGPLFILKSTRRHGDDASAALAVGDAKLEISASSANRGFVYTEIARVV